jgi:LemA protein
MKHKTLWITLGVIVFLVFAVFSWVKGSYNTMVSQDEGVKTAWSQVENQYQRRLDLIPNLVNTVKGYAAHEKETLEGVISARAEATKTTIDPSNLNEESLKKFQAAQGELSSALSRLMVVMERYPDLKANQNFSELQAQLEGTENRITVERKRFNEVAQAYNTYIRSFPNNILAGMFGFFPKAYFTADAGAEKAQKVEYLTKKV